MAAARASAHSVCVCACCALLCRSGVVWEEVMILMPPSVRYVFLSATIPNALEFAEWIAQLHSQPCHVVYTGYRPTPLTHYSTPSRVGRRR